MRSYFDSVASGVNLDADARERAWELMKMLEDKYRTFAHEAVVRGCCDLCRAAR